MAAPGATPYDFLAELDRRGRSHPLELGEQERRDPPWYGIGIRLAGRSYLVPIDEIVEILTCPPLARVPRTQPWLRGVANVRGSFFPVVDLGGYLGLTAVEGTSGGYRLMTVRRGEITAGLLVDEILGLRACEPESWRPGESSAGDPAESYITGGFARDDGVWPVLSPGRLLEDPQFLRVAA